jgi:Cys-tRNA(Pro)/Cys-tRNA(Cys) deacylase
MAKKSGSTPAVKALLAAGVDFTLHPYAHGDGETNFGDEVVRKLGVEPGRVFKTLVADLGGELVVGIVPVPRHLDLKALAGAFGAKKAALATPDEAARSTGYVLGGISPIGQRTPLRTVLDDSADAFATIFVSAGKRGLQVELSAADLRTISGATCAAIATG